MKVQDGVHPALVADSDVGSESRACLIAISFDVLDLAHRTVSCSLYRYKANIRQDPMEVADVQT